MSSTKRCTKCGMVKPLGEFARAKQAPGGVRSFCKECANAKQRAWKQQNPEKVQASRVKYYANVDRGVLTAAWQRRREANRAEILLYQRDYRAANRERRAELLREWVARNPEKVAEYQRRRRARKAGATIGEIDLDALWTGNCALCGGVMDASLLHPDPWSKSLDHIIPISRGGAHMQENLQYAHLICNQRKGARLIGEEAS